MIRVEPLDPGPLRQWWWRTTQRSRLTVLGGLTLLAMTLAGVPLAVLPNGNAPRAAAAPPASSTSSSTSSRPTTTSAPAPGDLAVTVTDVPAVDVLTGQDAEQKPVVIKIAGIAPLPSCRSNEALTAAAELLRGKQVRVPGGETATPDQTGRVVGTAVLPDGRDYAHTAVSGGLAKTDPAAPAPNASDLVAAEATAQQTAQGAWRPCTTEDPGDQASDGGTTTTDGQQTDVPGTQPPPNTDPPPDDDDPQPPTSDTTTPPEDDIQRGVREGDPCSPQGALGITDRGQFVVCRDSHHGPDGLRWRRR
jgi:endonuclease YncB( thermonuclease family)